MGTRPGGGILSLPPGCSRLTSANSDQAPPAHIPPVPPGSQNPMPPPVRSTEGFLHPACRYQSPTLRPPRPPTRAPPRAPKPLHPPVRGLHGSLAPPSLSTPSLPPPPQHCSPRVLHALPPCRPAQAAGVGVEAVRVQLASLLIPNERALPLPVAQDDSCCWCCQCQCQQQHSRWR